MKEAQQNAKNYLENKIKELGQYYRDVKSTLENDFDSTLFYENKLRRIEKEQDILGTLLDALNEQINC